MLAQFAVRVWCGLGRGRRQLRLAASCVGQGRGLASVLGHGARQSGHRAPTLFPSPLHAWVPGY